MSFLIGGLSSQQYKAYLNPTPEEKEHSPVNHWVTRFDLFRYPVLTVLINRIAYFLLHHLAVYPNNTYLFRKFKSHEFNKINTEEQYEVVKEIFARFRACSDLSKEELGKVEEKLQEVEERLHPDKAEDEEGFEEDKDVEKDRVELEEKKKSEQAKKTQQIEKKKEIDKILTDTKEPAGLDTDAEEASEEEIFDPEKDDVSPVTKIIAKETKKPLPLMIVKKGLIIPSKPVVKADDKGGQSPSKEKAPDQEDEVFMTPKEDSLSDSDEPDQIVRSLHDLLKSFSQDKKEVVEEDQVVELPKEVVDIVSQPFPLEDSKSVNDLKSADDQRLYRQNLKILLDFISQLQAENKITDDDRLATYMQKANEAFERAWDEAYSQSAELHADFVKAFSKQPAELNDMGEMICTAEQLQWVAKKIAERFPAIYSLAFDAPSLNIYQERKMASLARAICVGPDAHESAFPVDSNCFICIRETINKETSCITDDTFSNPLLDIGSFVYACFVGSKGKLSESVGNLKRQFEDLSHTYVTDWLERQGTTLMLGNFAATSGQLDELVNANDWVLHLVLDYTQTLKNMDPVKLKSEVLRTYQCPLIRAMIKAYADDIDAQSWSDSKFPAALMKEMFQKELRRAASNPDLSLAIRKVIDFARFGDESDIQELAQKADVSAEFIEPLIRIRVLYMMCCLGQNVVQPVSKKIKERIETMYDPALCQKKTDSALICKFNERRILQFDASFDELTILIKNDFTGPAKFQSTAQGGTRLTISSISRSNSEKKPVETSLTELEELRFSIYSSSEQTRYLVAQVVPDTLINNIQKLAQEVAALEIVKKAKKYEEVKKEQSSSVLGQVVNYAAAWWNKKEAQKPFNAQDYQDAKNDQCHLDIALSKASELVTYLNTEQILSQRLDLTEDQLDDDFKPALNTIRTQLREIEKMVGEVYPSKDEKWKDIQAKSRELHRLLQLQPDHYGIKKLDSSDSDSSRDPSPRSSDTDVELDIDDIEAYLEDEKGIIGKKAGDTQKTWTTHFWDYTAGAVLNETSEVKFLRWKIERYEELIRGVQDAIVNYIESQNLGGLDKLIQQAKKKGALEWMHQILPVLKFCCQDLRIGSDRLNPDYLAEVRKSYCDDMLKQLRCAANWAKDHSADEGAEHIDAICYHLYTSLNINERCQEILNTFLKLGEAALKKKAHTLPTDSRYAMIEGLREAHEMIKAVPNDAKAPQVKQWANSLRGHLNGFMGMTSFDPNMQSNPMHVLLHKIIKTKDKTTSVKDIAMGSPTIETGVGKAEANPEFLAFLRYCKSHGLKHYYINNQDYIPRPWIKGNESARCQVLHDLAENEFKGTLFVITLNQNSVFYQQLGHQLSGLNVETTKAEIMLQLLNGKSKEMGHYLSADLVKQPTLHQWMLKELDRLHRGEFEKAESFEDEKARDRFVERFHQGLLNYLEKQGETLGYSIYDSSAARFKEELVAQIFDRSPHETGNCIPGDLVAACDVREWGVEAIDQIHKKLFNDRKNLTVEERRIFIRLCYRNIARKGLIATEADSYNESCKDRIDRGAASDAEDFAYLAVLANCMNELKIIEFFKMLVFTRAIIVRKRSIIEERLDRLIETVKFMIDHQKRLKELQEELFPDVEITIDKFKLDLKDEEPFDEIEATV